jgi:Uma2 family endonuclease
MQRGGSIMTTEQTLLTAEDFLCLPPYDGRRELIDGKVVEMAADNLRHNSVMENTGVRLSNFVRANKLGKVMLGSAGIIVARNPDRVRCPDVCFFALNRIPPGGFPEAFTELVPDLIIEIVSPNDRATEVLDKTEMWLRAGARLVWTLYPKPRRVVTTDAERASHTYNDGDTLTGGDVLPGFSVPVAELFEED